MLQGLNIDQNMKFDDADTAWNIGPNLELLCWNWQIEMFSKFYIKDNKLILILTETKASRLGLETDAKPPSAIFIDLFPR